MVATDVASRGIGEYHRPPLLPLPEIHGNFQQRICCALLLRLGAISHLRELACCTTCPLGSQTLES